MIRPDVTKWNQTVADLRRLAIEAAHPRTRERFQALYMIGSQPMNVACVPAPSGGTVEIGGKIASVGSLCTLRLVLADRPVLHFEPTLSNSLIFTVVCTTTDYADDAD